MEDMHALMLDAPAMCGDSWHYKFGGPNEPDRCPRCGQQWKMTQKVRGPGGDPLIYKLMRTQPRRTALLRLAQDAPRIYRCLSDFVEYMAAVYENKRDELGDGWLVADPIDLAYKIDNDAHPGLVAAVLAGGDSTNVRAEAADVALLAMMAAVRTEEEKRERRAAAGWAYHSPGFGIPDLEARENG